MKILVVDDSLMDRKIMINTLKKGGVDHEILEAADGEIALKILSENFKDIILVLLDWQMPNMDGIEFMQAVVKVPEVAGVPIVMVTASGSDDNKRYAHQINPNLAGYVVKPYNAHKLFPVIKPLLDRKK